LRGSVRHTTEVCRSMTYVSLGVEYRRGVASIEIRWLAAATPREATKLREHDMADTVADDKAAEVPSDEP